MSNALPEYHSLLVSPNISLFEALIILKNTGKKCLIIVSKKKKLLGTLTDGDIRTLILLKKNLNQSISKLYNSKPKFYFEKNFNLEIVKKDIIKNRYELVPVINKFRKVVDVLTWDKVFARNKEIINKKVNNCELIIMAGGEGTRMQPFTSIFPKPLIPVNGKTILEHIITKFSKIGVKKFTISLGYKNKTIMAFFKSLKLEFKIKFLIETKPLGTIGSLSLFKKKNNNNDIFVSNCDVLVNSDLAEIYDFHKKHDHDLTIVTAAKNFKVPYGVCETSAKGIFKNIIEKPSYSALVNTGVYILKQNILSLIPKSNKFDITDLINLAKKKKKKIGLFPITEESWVDVGQWNEYKLAAKKFEI